MRTTVVALLVALGFSVSASAQAQRLRVEITDGEFTAGMAPIRMSYVMGGPSAAIPARGVKADLAPTVTDFRIRTWFEGAGVRVAVFAVTRSASPEIGVVRQNEREEQIASVVVYSGQSAQISTEKYNARSITIRASTVELDVRAVIEEARRITQAINAPK
jgi:hypothetical protein